MQNANVSFAYPELLTVLRSLLNTCKISRCQLKSGASSHLDPSPLCIIA